MVTKNDAEAFLRAVCSKHGFQYRERTAGHSMPELMRGPAARLADELIVALESVAAGKGLPAVVPLSKVKRVRR